MIVSIATKSSNSNTESNHYNNCRVLGGLPQACVQLQLSLEGCLTVDYSYLLLPLLLSLILLLLLLF